VPIRLASDLVPSVTVVIEPEVTEAEQAEATQPAA
jgi:hypothetical protein